MIGNWRANLITRLWNIIQPTNNLREVIQRLTGKTISIPERLQQLLEQGDQLFNEGTFTEDLIYAKEKRKEKDQGYSTNKVLPFFGVALTNHDKRRKKYI